MIESHGKGEGSAENRRELWLRNSAMESRGKERRMITAKRNLGGL